MKIYLIVLLFLAALLPEGIAGNITGKKTKKQAGRTYVVDQNNPKASDTGNGNLSEPFRTISAAAELAGPGDTVLVFGGVYRERVAPAKGGTELAPAVYMAAPEEKVILKGSELWNPDWQRISDTLPVFEGKFDLQMFGDYNPFTIKAAALQGNRTIGQVFVNGRIFAEVDNIKDLTETPGTWLTDGKGLKIHFNHGLQWPERNSVEITVRGRIFAPHKRGLGYITVRGFYMEHCANQFPGGFYLRDRDRGHPQAGALGTRSGNHWVIENNVIRWANSIGIDCGSEGGFDIEGDQPRPDTTGYHIIRYNEVSDNGACGIAGAGAPHSVISYNLIERNNFLGWNSPEVGGIKVHWFTNGIIEGNIVRDNDAHGIWLDNGCINSRVTRNVVINSRGDGIFTELADGPVLIDNNVVAYTRLGDGIYAHDCSGMTFVNNLLYGNSHFGILIKVVSNRGRRGKNGERKLVGAHDITILNNVFVDNYRGNISIPLNSPRVYNNHSDYNLFINGAQWHWEGLLNTRFNLNMANGRLDEKGNILSEDAGDISGRHILADKLDSALNSHHIPEDRRPNYNLWIEEPYLTLDWWKMLTGFDTHSAVPELGAKVIENGALSKGMVSLSTLEMYFDTKDNIPFEMIRDCPPVEGMDKDFYGNPYKPGNIIPGPFQHYREGYNRFVLRPRVME